MLSLIISYWRSFILEATPRNCLTLLIVHDHHLILRHPKNAHNWATEHTTEIHFKATVYSWLSSLPWFSAKSDDFMTVITPCWTTFVFLLVWITPLISAWNPFSHVKDSGVDGGGHADNKQPMKRETLNYNFDPNGTAFVWLPGDNYAGDTFFEWVIHQEIIYKTLIKPFQWVHLFYWCGSDAVSISLELVRWSKVINDNGNQ